MNHLLIRSAGYSKKATTGAPTVDLEHLRRLGGAVLFAALVAALEWAFASTAFAGGAPLVLRILLALGLSALAAGIVFFFDSSALLFMDTRPEGRSSKWFVIVRALLIFTFASITAERIVQVVLQPEMQARALYERERNEAERQAGLSGRYGVPELERRLGTAETDVNRLEEESRVTPAPIQAELDRAVGCRRALVAERSRLRRRGYTQRQVSASLAGRAAFCRRIGNEAQADLRTWREDMAERLEAARARAADARDTHAGARAAVDERVEEARTIEREAIQPGSVALLGRTIFSSPAALLMALAFYIVSLSIQLLPFILKHMAGPTALGRRFAAEREMAALLPQTSLARARDEAEIETAASRAAAEASIAALRGEDVRARMESEAAERAKMTAPIHAALRTYREILNAKREIDIMTAGVDEPELAVLGQRLWTEAVCRLEAHLPGEDETDGALHSNGGIGAKSRFFVESEEPIESTKVT